MLRVIRLLGMASMGVMLLGELPIGLIQPKAMATSLIKPNSLDGESVKAVNTENTAKPNLNQELDQALAQASSGNLENTENADKTDGATAQSAGAVEILNRDLNLPPTQLPAKKAPSSIPEEESLGISSTKQKVAAPVVHESDIPILTAIKANDPLEKNGERYSWRLLVSLGFVILFAVAMAIGTKYWTRNRLGQQSQNKIRILTQHHLSPKKSLAIIQVAGESLLLGITEQNIQLIKPLSLIDDEIPDSTPSHFYNELEAFDSTALESAEIKDRVEIQPASRAIPASVPKEEIEVNLKGIQSRIANRLREMRSL